MRSDMAGRYVPPRRFPRWRSRNRCCWVREEQHGVFDCAEWDEMDRARQVQSMQAAVERVGYDGAARQISIRFHAAEITTAESEAGV